jgi:hypothetical protein
MPAMPDPTTTVSQALSPSSRPALGAILASIQRERERLSKLTVIGLLEHRMDEVVSADL